MPVHALTEERRRAQTLIAEDTPTREVAYRLGVSERTIQRWAQTGFEPRKRTTLTLEQYRQIEMLLARYTRRSLLWAVRKVCGAEVPKHLVKQVETYARRLAEIGDYERRLT